MAAIPQNPRQLPPWSGPTGPQTVLPLSTAAEQPSVYPFPDDNAKAPPVCIRSHWDPEQIIRRTLPNAQLATPLDPRPWTKVCMNYVTTQAFEDAPRPSDDLVMPTGGTVYPPSRYRESVDKESLLRGLDRPLGTCERNQYIPPRSSDLYRPAATVPDRLVPPNSRFVEELAFPKACLRSGPYECREQQDQAAWMRSPRPFNNTTKQDRYAVSRPGLIKPQPMPQPIPESRVSLS